MMTPCRKLLPTSKTCGSSAASRGKTPAAHEMFSAAVFCASKKSLAAGAPMAALIFGANPGLGLILLPIMIYHPLQLIVCSVMAESYATRSPQEAAEPNPAVASAGQA